MATKGLNRGGIQGQEGELSNNIAPEGSVDRRPLPQRAPQARNPFMDEESIARRDRDLRGEPEPEN